MKTQKVILAKVVPGETVYIPDPAYRYPRPMLVRRVMATMVGNYYDVVGDNCEATYMDHDFGSVVYTSAADAMIRLIEFRRVC